MGLSVGPVSRGDETGNLFFVVRGSNTNMKCSLVDLSWQISWKPRFVFVPLGVDLMASAIRNSYTMIRD